MTIGIFTTFYNFDSAYSLTSVVKDQLTALVKHKYKTVLFVLPNFKDDAKVPKGVEIRKVIPQLILEPYKGTMFPDHWQEDAKKVTKSLKENAGDITHMICHDIFFIDQYLPYNIGLREAELPCKIFAWIHSAPSTRPALEGNPHANRFTLPKRTKLVYLNHVDITRVAEMYGAWDKDVRVIHNARDPRTFWNLDPFVIKLADKYGILDADIISVYPLSTPRMVSGKCVDKVIKLHGKLKELGYKTCLIVPNAHANAEKDKKMIAQTQVFASDRGIGHTELIFTSLEEVPKYEHGVSPKQITDLFHLSNVFIFPTISENCSLILLEAMLAGNLLVLNDNVKSLREFGKEQALYFDFDYRKPEEENENYYLDLAKILASQFEIMKPLQAKRNVFKLHNYDSIFKKQIEPLFYE